MRLPLEVEAVIFRRKPSLEFLILHRVPEKGGFWQNLSGGVEEGESLLDTLKRELKEEVDIGEQQIKRIVEDVYFHEWYQGQQEIKEWVFAVEVEPNIEIKLSEEHDEYKWCSAEEAKALLKWEDTKIAIDRTIQKLKL
jgi:8-oxo-dGTP pyrophosphatase MutT (NUDIX family)